MKKRMISMLLATSMMFLSACAGQNNNGCQNGCNCSGCKCCGTSSTEDAVIQTDASDVLGEGAQETADAQTQDAGIQIQPSTQDASMTEAEASEESQQTQVQEQENVSQLTEEEKQARKQKQAEIDATRQFLYTQPNSRDKTDQINQLDKQIIANNTFDFSGKNIIFIGDSITEGICGGIDQNGNYISYVNYVNSNLHFGNVINQGKGGRMFSDYGGTDYSLSINFDNVTNVDANIIIVFAGVNDYLNTSPDKRYGNPDDTISTAGYCGSLRYFMKQLQMYYSDREIFFVTMYNISKTSNSPYSDVATPPTLADYMEDEKKLAREYGFHIIDLYGTGFMDCSNQESSDYYLDDGLHPKDTGNIVLGEHIAAELSLYFGQKQ